VDIAIWIRNDPFPPVLSAARKYSAHAGNFKMRLEKRNLGRGAGLSAIDLHRLMTKVRALRHRAQTLEVASKAKTSERTESHASRRNVGVIGNRWK
jgi:hypothetical protein